MQIAIETLVAMLVVMVTLVAMPVVKAMLVAMPVATATLLCYCFEMPIVLLDCCVLCTKYNEYFKSVGWCISPYICNTMYVKMYYVYVCLYREVL